MSQAGSESGTRHLHQSAGLQRDRGRLVGGVRPATLGAPLLNPAQYFDLAVIERIMKAHNTIRSHRLPVHGQIQPPGRYRLG